MFKEMFQGWLQNGFAIFAGLSFLLLFFHKASGLIFGDEPLTHGFFELSQGSFALLFGFGALLLVEEFWNQIWKR
jgi:hypothetical protein